MCLCVLILKLTYAAMSDVFTTILTITFNIASVKLVINDNPAF